MTTNLLENMKTQLTPEMVQQMSVLLDETPATTLKAVDGIMPTLLAGVMHFSSSGSGATQLVDTLAKGDYGNVLNNLSGLLNPGNTAERMMSSGRNILGMLFPTKLPAVSEMITTYSGIKSTSAASLLSLAAPVVLGVIARTRAVQGLNAEGLTMLLLSQKEGILKLAPQGLTHVLGLNGETDLGAKVASLATAMVSNGTPQARWEEGNKTTGRPPWGWLLVGIAALSVVYWLWGRGTGVSPLGVSTLPQTSALALELRPTLPLDSPSDWVVRSPTKSPFPFPLTTFREN
jgi:OmpA-OmpF porin, OOP family